MVPANSQSFNVLFLYFFYGSQYSGRKKGRAQSVYTKKSMQYAMWRGGSSLAILMIQNSKSAELTD